jgi:hypothetical protein
MPGSRSGLAFHALARRTSSSAQMLALGRQRCAICLRGRVGLLVVDSLSEDGLLEKRSEGFSTGLHGGGFLIGSFDNAGPGFRMVTF